MNIPASMNEQIENAKSLEISYRTLHEQAILKDKISGRNIQIPFASFTDKYKEKHNTIIVTVSLSDEERARYRYKPKMVSYDLYNTTEFWNDLLIINNFFSLSEFQPGETMKVYDPNKLKDYINEIMIIEKLV